MYALKYGTIPVVRATGGLDDTIQDFRAAGRTGNGFKFEDAAPEALLASLRQALEIYSRLDLWSALIRNAMASDFSWTRSAGEYLALYRKILAQPKA
jgi:starch synthase